MHWMLSAALMAATPPGASYDAGPTAHYVSYTTGYEAARAQGRPMLLILNPGADSTGEAVTFEALSKTRQRRDLLKKYVVVIVDSQTRHGRQVRESFRVRQLPYVAVIDKRQQKQIYRTSEALQGQQWTWILDTYQTGERPASASYFDPRLCST